MKKSSTTFTGNPCPRGHTTRYVISRKCAICNRERNHPHNLSEEVRERRRVYARAYVKRRRVDDPVFARKAREQSRKTGWRLSGIKITTDEYDSLYADQNGRCRICSEPPPEHKRLGVDHDHATGLVRGLLCDDCNVALGRFKDDVDRLNSAITYLLSV